MKIIYWGKGDKGVRCLEALHQAGHNISLVVTHPGTSQGWYGSVGDLAKKLNLESIAPDDPNMSEAQNVLRNKEADLFILSGYGKILKQETIDIPKMMTINLHSGKLPKYRGSSPLNWSLINDEKNFSLSIIEVDSGVDTGPILNEKTFDISETDTIRDLHNIANEQFPGMLLETLQKIKNGSLKKRMQDKSEGSYYPLRFPDDGLIIWDTMTARQVHNRIRGLTEPYPCAFTYYQGKKIKLITSELYTPDFFGEPGRIYKKTARGLLVCAADKCLWINEAKYDDNTSALHIVERYNKFATLRDSLH